MVNTPIKRAASGDTLDAADIKRGRLTCTGELHDQSDAKHVVCDYDTMSVESNGLAIETSEHSNTPSEIEKKHDEEVKEEERYEEAKDIQDVCEIEREQGFNRFNLVVDPGDTKAVRRLPRSLVDVNVLDTNKNTPSHVYATVNGLINKNASDDLRSSLDQTHSAIVQGIPNIQGKIDVLRKPLKCLIQPFKLEGPADDLNELLTWCRCHFVTSSHNETPLHVAVKERQTKVVEAILKQSSMIYRESTKDGQTLQKDYTNFIESRAYTPIEFMKSDGRHVFAEIIWAKIWTPLEIIQESRNGFTALDFAVKSAQLKMVKILLSVDQCAYSEKHLGNSLRCLLQTITEYKFDVMGCKIMKRIARVLMNSSRFNVNHQDDELNTLLHCAINHVHEYLTNRSRWRVLPIKNIYHVIELLLKKGADFNMKNALGETPLILASEKGCCHIIQTLFDWEQKSGMKLDVDARDQYGATALIKAAETHHVSVMRLLLNHKVSVNLHDYCGFTALHAVVYEPNRNWFDLYFFYKEIRKRKPQYLDDTFEVSHWNGETWEQRTSNSFITIGQLEVCLEHEDKTTRLKEDMVKLLLAIDDTDVNAVDFRGNTPLDLAVKSSKRITSEAFKALKNRGAIKKLLESKDEAPIEVGKVDERGRNPLHRLIISHILNYSLEDRLAAKRVHDNERFRVIVDSVLLLPEYFRWSVTATDHKGRTPLHYAVMSPSCLKHNYRDLVRMFLEMGSNVNATDIYGKTPLHYSETTDEYELLVHYGADETTKDRNGHTARDLTQLRESITIGTYNTTELLIETKALYTSSNISRILKADQLTDLSNRKVAESVRIYSQSPRPNKSSEEAIWQVWSQNDFLMLNRRVSQLRPSIQRLVERLADGIKERDPRFECQPILVGSAEEETRVAISADFDFNFKLINFSQLCDVFPHPLGPKGYFQLRLTKDNTERIQSDKEFDCFFNLDQCLLTNEVNSRFQIVLENVIDDRNFWQDEHIFELNVADIDENKPVKPARLCKTVQLRMINPISDGEGGFLFIDISIDVVACVHLEESWLGDELPVAIHAVIKADDCTLVFDRPCFDLFKSGHARSIFSDTFARISFAPLESRIIRDSSSLMKAAYMVCKVMFYRFRKITYELKTSLLFCMEAFKDRKEFERKDDKFTPKELAFWVERLVFCYIEFARHGVYPCYFMASFRQRVVEQINRYASRDTYMVDVYLESKIPFSYSEVCDIYLDLCPDDTLIDIPIIQKSKYDYNEGSLIATQDPTWEQFNPEEFIEKLSSRCSSY